MKFRVYEVKTNKDITDEREWVINTDGNLLYILNGNKAYVSKEKYYYRIENQIENHIKE